MLAIPATSRVARPNRARLQVQALEAREVPAVVNLSVPGAEEVVNGAILRQLDTGPIPADQFDTFLRIQDCGVERGYNSDAPNHQFDEVGDSTVTHALRLADIPTVVVNGVTYRQFLLDVNESAWSPRISLDELRFFVAETPDLSGYNSWSRKLAGQSAVFDLDSDCNVSVKLNAALNAGTGKGDAEFLIPDSVFGGATYVYLYSKFGSMYFANGGAEEWGVTAVPDDPVIPGTLSGFVYFDADDDGVREPDGNADDVPEIGLQGVTIRLEGIDDLGQRVDILIVTDENGRYEFTDVLPGTYSVTKLFDPEEFRDGRNTPGDPNNGTVQESNSDPDVLDMIFNITLVSGQGLSEYNFGEIFAT